MIYDFPERAQYHVIRQFADEIALVDSLAVSRRKWDFNAELALSVLEETKYQPVKNFGRGTDELRPSSSHESPRAGLPTVFLATATCPIQLMCGMSFGLRAI